jgi:hypothetical protein
MSVILWFSACEVGRDTERSGHRSDATGKIDIILYTQCLQECRNSEQKTEEDICDELAAFV